MAVPAGTLIPPSHGELLRGVPNSAARYAEKDFPGSPVTRKARVTVPPRKILYGAVRRIERDAQPPRRGETRNHEGERP
jgi:hypothetical protein